VSRIAQAEIGQLQSTFNQMVSSLAERETRQREEHEAKLYHSERQASVGRLAAGVAHEINNPLTGTLTFTHLLLRRTDLPEGAHKDLEVIARSTERVRDIVRGLLDFSRQTQLAPETIDLNELVRHTISLVENQALIKGIRLGFEAGDGLPKLTADRSQIQSVILNIVLNAIDATDSGGAITVGTAAAVVADARREDGSARGGIQIVVTDTGSGIPPENLPRLFEPFFTTKEVGKGTGMGLCVSLGIVEKHGGTIRVTSTVGRGSTFVIWLPADEGGYGQ
jgi:two-component system NtrC family sensor kinase